MWTPNVEVQRHRTKVRSVNDNYLSISFISNSFSVWCPLQRSVENLRQDCSIPHQILKSINFQLYIQRQIRRLIPEFSAIILQVCWITPRQKGIM